MADYMRRLSTESPAPVSARRLSTLGSAPADVESTAPSARESSSRSFTANAFRRALSHVRGSQVDENPLSPRNRDSQAIETAGRMLSPVLSRAREAALEHEAERSSMSLSDAEPASTLPSMREARSPGHTHFAPLNEESIRHVNGDAQADVRSEVPSEKSKKPNAFRATAQVINALTHPVSMPKQKGGEGIRRLVETREKNSHFLGLSVEYWDISLFSFRGRAWPMLPQVIYVVYSTVIVSIICSLVPNYTKVIELSGLQYLISTMGLALFLLLSFRTNSSYERWWEGRQLWDNIINQVDDITRVSLAWVAAKDRPCASGLIRWALAYAFVAKKALRTDLKYPELAGILSQKEIDELENDIDPITLVSDKLSALVHQSAVGPAEVSPAIFSGVDGDIKGLNLAFISCMRILGTPMPFAYIIHLRSFIVLWLLGLPLAFVVQLGYWSILVCTVVGYELLGFETISVEVENPFGTDFNDLPLDTITAELFVKSASALAKLGHMVDIEPIVKADPLFNECRHAPVQYSRRGSEALPDLPEVVIPVRMAGPRLAVVPDHDDGI